MPHDISAPPDAAATLGQPDGLKGFAVVSTAPAEHTAIVSAALIALLVHDGENVAAMVPVETGIDAPCAPGSAGALVRWAAGHMDDPRLVTPFAFESSLPMLHAADAAGTLLHTAAFDRARTELCDGRTRFVLCETNGVLDAITTSLTPLDLVTRWQLPAIIVEPLSRFSIAHARALAAVLQMRAVPLRGIVLTPEHEIDAMTDETRLAIRDSASAILGCPVLILPRVRFTHDRAELVAAARAGELSRVTADGPILSPP
jgi:dethiobiotin synthetase